MTFQSLKLHLWWRIFAVLQFTASIIIQSYGLNLDGVLLLSFKYSVVSDPLGKLANWNVLDDTPCAWTGVICSPLNMTKPSFRVIGLTLPNSELIGSIPANLGMIQNLKTIDLSNNTLNGSIPLSIFLASELQTLDISNNELSGEIPELVAGLKSLQILNFSDNALSGKIPQNLTSLRNLTSVSLKNNYFSGNLPGGFDSVQVLDLSSNLINGSLPADFGGNNISYFNVSFNKISGEIPPEFYSKIPLSATLDLSFNNISGEIPENSVLFNQDSKSFDGNSELCGKPLKKLCPIPSTMTTPPDATQPISSPPAIAAIPKTIDSSPADTSGSADESSAQESSSGLKPIIIVAIVVANVAILTFFVVVFICIYQFKRKKNVEGNIKKEAESAKEFDWASSSRSEEEYNWLRTWTCLKKPRHGDAEEETSSESSNTESEENEEMQTTHLNKVSQEKKNGELVTIDGEKELELETLLKASAYILGASGSSIMYKAVLEDGTALAVRRIGESGVERFKDFENQVRVIAKLVHPNLVKIRGFYWGVDEKLVIYDYVPNGSLANARYRKAGTSPCHLPWEIRLKIATGVARGLSYIHDKKHVHGNLKPSNILLGQDMEAKIGDFGLERLVTGENSSKAFIGSARYFGSKRSTASRESFHDFGFGPTGPTPSPSPSAFAVSPYYAPESLRSIKPNPKWDVFSFGVVLLELLTGKIIVSDDMGPGLVLGDFEEKSRVLRMADVAIRNDLEGKEDAYLALLKIGYSCISPVPQRRPSMKEVVHALDKFPTSSSSSLYLGL